jgi:hypothetical protein
MKPASPVLSLVDTLPPGAGLARGVGVRLVGRDRERGVLSGLLNRLPLRGAALVVRGEPGIGKSALLEETTRAAAGQGTLVLRTCGVPSEAGLPCAALHQLLRPVLSSADVLPPRQRAALGAAFGTADGDAPDPFLIALATLHLLSEVAAQAPVLLVADDAQWLDRPSADVLAFTARRLETDPVVLLAAIRDGYPSPLLERAFAARAAELPPATRTLLLIATADDHSELAQVMRAAAIAAGTGAGPTFSDLVPAVEAGLIHADDHVRFRHPCSAPPSTRPPASPTGTPRTPPSPKSSAMTPTGRPGTAPPRWPVPIPPSRTALRKPRGAPVPAVPSPSPPPRSSAPLTSPPTPPAAAPVSCPRPKPPASSARPTTPFASCAPPTPAPSRRVTGPGRSGWETPSVRHGTVPTPP